jgi:hypothetical protein
MSESIFAALKNRPYNAYQMDTDALASCLRVMAQNLDKLLPDTKSLFSNLTEAMQGHLEALRNRRFNAYECFTGQGSVAHKLREHLLLTQWFEPESSARLADLPEQINEAFNKNPIQDEAALTELTDFIKLTQPLMVGQSLRGQVFEEIDASVALPKLKSGFYVCGPETNRRFSMVLNPWSVPLGIGLSYVLSSGQEPHLLLQHPEENEWFLSDYTFTFPQLVSYLKQELDTLIAPLGFSVTRLDMDIEFEHIFAKVNLIFDQHVRLPASGLQAVLNEAEQTQITIPFGSDYVWSFVDTRGKYPSRTNRFFYRVGPSVQPADPADFNEFSRQNMVKFLNLELDQILSAMNQVAEAA